MSSKKKTAVTLSPRGNGLSKSARELLARVKVAARSPRTPITQLRSPQVRHKVPNMLVMPVLAAAGAWQA